VHDLAAALELALGALHEARGGARGVVVARARERAAELGDLACVGFFLLWWLVFF
jgi:hypothetical protein